MNNHIRNLKTLFIKKPWLGIILIILNIFLIYNSVIHFSKNNVQFPDIEVDNGTIRDRVFHNKYLNWTFKIPSEYSVTPIHEIDRVREIGNELLENENKINKPIRLLNISTETVDMMSNLNPRVLYPHLTTEDKYFEEIAKRFGKLANHSITVNKINQGALLIDRLEFKYVEYVMTNQKGQVGMMFLSRFNKDYMFDISLTYKNTQDALCLINKLKDSELDWK
jgi:hypothetical protein